MICSPPSGGRRRDLSVCSPPCHHGVNCRRARGASLILFVPLTCYYGGHLLCSSQAQFILKGTFPRLVILFSACVESVLGSQSHNSLLKKKCCNVHSILIEKGRHDLFFSYSMSSGLFRFF